MEEDDCVLCDTLLLDKLLLKFHRSVNFVTHTHQNNQKKLLGKTKLSKAFSVLSYFFLVQWILEENKITIFCLHASGVILSGNKVYLLPNLSLIELLERKSFSRKYSISCFTFFSLSWKALPHFIKPYPRKQQKRDIIKFIRGCGCLISPPDGRKL